MKYALTEIAGSYFRNLRFSEVSLAIRTPLEEGKLDLRQSDGHRLSRYLGRLLRTDLPTEEVHNIIREYARGNRES